MAKHKRRQKRDTETEQKTHAQTHDAHKEKDARNFYEQNRKAIKLGLTILLLLIPLFLAFSFRSYPAGLAVADQWAESSIKTSIRNQLGQNIDQQYPYLPADSRQERIAEEFASYMEDNGEQVENQTALLGERFRSKMQDGTGQTYLLAIDPYHYMRLTEDVLDHGYPGDEIRDGKPYDTHMKAPIGTPVSMNFHVWVGSTLTRIVSSFTDKSPMAIFFWLPTIFATLAVIPAFFIGRRFGLLTSFFIAVLIAVHSGFVGRTAVGFADTDAYVVLFPLLIAYFLLEAFETKLGDQRRQLIFLALSGLSIGVFSWAWGNWWYFFDVFLFALAAYIGYHLLRYVFSKGSLEGFFSSREVKTWAVTFFGFILFSVVFVAIFKSPAAVIDGPLSALQRTVGIKAAVHIGDLWPNVFTTVAELNAPSINGIINNIGGKFLFVLSLMGVLATIISTKKTLLKDWVLLVVGLLVGIFLVQKGGSLTIMQFLIVMAIPVCVGFLLLLKDEREIDVKYALFLFVWLAASVFTMTKGVRFVLLLIPPFAIAAGIAVGRAYNLMKEWLVSEVKFDALWVAPVLFVLFALLLIPPITAGHQTGLNEAPSMNDAWWDSLTKIKQESEPDAIINSWWDFGHWFKYVADRAVTFDGASQNTPMAHWIGRVLITNDEKEALAILRMLDCGSSQGVEDVREGLKTDDYYMPITLTKEIIMLPPDEAEARLLEEGIPSEQVAVILNHTHCDPPEDYFITSGDMVGKGGVWGHFGSWNFERADAYQNFRNLPQAEAVPAMAEKYGWAEEEASKIYYSVQTLSNEQAVNSWISPWPGFPMGSWRSCQQDASLSNVSVCKMGVVVNNQNGAQTVLEALVLNETNVTNSFLIFGSYNAQGQRVGASSNLKPAKLFFARNDSMEGVVNDGADFNQAFMVDLRGNNPRALMLDPANVDSMFTKLFFMNGWATKGFEKFSDQTTFTGSRIIVWKVDWGKLDEFGLV